MIALNVTEQTSCHCLTLRFNGLHWGCESGRNDRGEVYMFFEKEDIIPVLDDIISYATAARQDIDVTKQAEVGAGSPDPGA